MSREAQPGTRRATTYREYRITLDETSPLGRAVHVARPNGEVFSTQGGGDDSPSALRKRARAAIDEDLQRQPTIGPWMGQFGPMRVTQRGHSIVVTFADGGVQTFPDAPQFWAHAYPRGWKPTPTNQR